MRDQFDSLCSDWQQIIHTASNSTKLLLLKQFRDDLHCLPELAEEFSADYSSVLRHRYPSLDVSDVYHHLSSDVQRCLGYPPERSSDSTYLEEALKIDWKVRQYFRSITPLHNGWRSWRDSQIQRFHHEDKTLRESHIMYIPFAIELTQGCSGGCPFCGVSAAYLEPEKPLFGETRQYLYDFFLEMKSAIGDFSRCGVLYWATDPLDHPEYLRFAALFEEVFRTYPVTTTALGEKYPERFKELLASNALKRPWGVRCSLRSKEAYKQIQKITSDQERFAISFIPQYLSSADIKANAGRNYSPLSESNEPKAGGTIACMAGFLIRLPKTSLELITPCLAEPNHQNGYRTLFKIKLNSLSELSSKAAHVYSQLPIQHLTLEDRLHVTIHPSQFTLYEHHDFPGVLNILANESLSLKQLISALPGCNDRAGIMSYCLRLIQHGVIRSCGQK